MAEGKKSFILYADILHTVEKLDDTQAGKLFKHILRYVNDQDPQPEDMITEIVFEPIKQQLKRDLEKWQNTSVKRSNSGRLGGLKSGEARQTKPQQIEANEANASNTKQNEANEAVNVNVNVNVNGNDNGIKEEECENKFSHTPASDPEPEVKHKKEKKIKYADEVQMTESEHEKLVQDFGPADTDELVDILNNYKGATGKKYKSDYLAIRNWVVDRLKEKRQKENKNGNNQRSGNTPATSDEEFLAAIANGMARGLKQREERERLQRQQYSAQDGGY